MSSEEAAIKGMNQQAITIECTDTYCKDEITRIKVEFKEVFEKPNSLPPQRPEDHRIELIKDAKLPPWRPLGRLNELVPEFEAAKRAFGINFIFMQDNAPCQKTPKVISSSKENEFQPWTGLHKILISIQLRIFGILSRGAATRSLESLTQRWN
jgi:hypothetical protein